MDAPAPERFSETESFLAMKPGGYYSRAADGARKVILGALDILAGAMEKACLESRVRPFRCGDFGCSDGGTSMELWRELFRVLSKLDATPPELFYDDLPNNDFNSLFKTIHGQGTIASYLNEFPSVLTYATANSFHRSVLSPGSLGFGFSALATHYLSMCPTPIPDHIHMVGATGKERMAYEEQGRKDWDAMLLSRTIELAKGGRMCILNPGIDEAGRYLGNTGGVHIFDMLAARWLDRARASQISFDEFLNTNFAQYYRTVGECVSPLLDKSSAIHLAGLRLEHVETRVVACPKAQAFFDHGDPRRFAAEYTPSLRSWVEPTLARGLATTRTQRERSEILDSFFEDLECSIAEQPEGHALDYVHIYLICRKE